MPVCAIVQVTDTALQENQSCYQLHKKTRALQHLLHKRLVMLVCVAGVAGAIAVRKLAGAVLRAEKTHISIFFHLVRFSRPPSCSLSPLTSPKFILVD